MYFDKTEKQYKRDLILNPPIYTKLEIATVLSKLKKVKVVDFGSGTGRLTLPLLKNNRMVTAVDVSIKSLVKLKKLANLQGFKNIKTDTVIAKTDAIVGCDVLHHVNISEYFKKFYNNLTDSGQIVFSEPNGWNIFWYIFIWLKLDWQEEKGVMDINYYNLKKQLIKAGFEDVQIEGLGILPGPIGINSSICRLNYWLGSLPILKIFAYRLIISARKN